VGVSRDCPNSLRRPYPLLSQERVKVRISNFVGTFIGSIGTNAHKNAGNSSRGHSQEVPKIFRAPMYRAHGGIARSSLRQHSFLVHKLTEISAQTVITRFGHCANRLFYYFFFNFSFS